jgi:2-dehydropantoate 2-reductase
VKIAVMGAGGVGGYYGALLARSGQDVAFIARGEHLRAIRSDGLRVRSVHGDFSIGAARAVEDPAEIGPVDVVLFAVKTYDTAAAAASIRPIVGAETTVLPLQNGVDAAESVGGIVGPARLVGGTTWLSAAVEEPGVIGQYSPFRRVVVGEMDGLDTSRVRTIVEAFRRAGAEAEISTDIRKILWTKFVFIAATSALGALTRVAIGAYRDVPETRAVLGAALEEVAAVGRAAGVALDTDIVKKTMEFIGAAAPGLKPSLQRDVEAGRRSELESMIGVVVRLGKARGVPVPVLGLAYALLKPGSRPAEEAAAERIVKRERR